MYRELNVDCTVETLQTLNKRVAERFPGSGLASVGEELCEIARETRERIVAISPPHYPTRIFVTLFIALMAGLIWYSIREFVQIRNEDKLSIADLVGIIEAMSNEVILAGAALIFLFSIETRIKRTRALKVLHQFRAVAHVIDMHQLTKDPSRLAGHVGESTQSSPKRTMNAFQLTRYLNYCSELLALVGKLAALYAQSLPDQVVVGVVNEIETLTAGLSRKIWQKIMLLDNDLVAGKEQSEQPSVGSGPTPTDAPKTVLPPTSG